MALKDIVEVNITRQTTSVAVAAFNVPLILSQFATNKTTTAFTRARVYGSVAEMASDGWASTDAVYKIANAIFSQDPSVNKIVVGRKDSNDATIDAALNAIANENNDWYGIVVDQALVSSFADVASWVETAKKFAIFWITDVNAYDQSKSTDLASVLKLANRNRSAVVWHATPAGGADYPDAAWMGEGFPYEPGTSTWAYKTLNGVTPDTLLASRLRAFPRTTSRQPRKPTFSLKTATSIPKSAACPSRRKARLQAANTSTSSLVRTGSKPASVKPYIPHL